MKRREKTALCATIGLALTMACPVVHAQVGEARAPDQGVQPDDGLGDIVVTAQKRAESLQRVPLAITAVTADSLERSGIRDLSGVVAVVPNLNLGQQLGVAKVALRGVGLENLSPGAEGSVAFHVDGVFESRSIVALASFYDVEQVEVLRGPQGTLYGRNATGGSINVTTRRPTEEPSGYVNLTVGNYGRVGTAGAVSGALVPGLLSARVAFQTEDRDGYGRNLFSGRRIDDLNSRSVRGKLLFTPADRLSFELTASYHRQKDSSGSYHYIGGAGFSAPGVPYPPFGIAYGGQVAANPRNIFTDIEPSNDVRLWGLTGVLTYDLDTVELRSITAFRKTKYSTLSDLDSTSAPLASITQRENAKQFSQELQLSGRGERIKWLLGAYYFHENDYGAQVMPFNNYLVGFPAPGEDVQGAFFGGRIKTDAYALFGQGSYELVDNLSLTVGLRYSWEKKGNFDQFMFDFETPYDPSVPLALTTLERSKWFKAFTPRVAIDYQLTPDVLFYASWSKGFKSGTYNLGQLADPVDPEKVDSWEAGVKSTLFDRRLRLNLAGFYYKYKDLQVGKVVGQVLALENAANATIYGLEAEVAAELGPRVELNANGAWLHARFDNYVSADPARQFGDGVTVDPDSGAPAFDLAGNTLSQAPEFTFFVGAQYRLPTAVGDISFRGELSWRDRVYFTPFNIDAVSQASNMRVNAFINWESVDANWRLSAFVKNLTNKTLIGNAYVSSPLLGSPIQAYLEEPRTYGLTVGYKF